MKNSEIIKTLKKMKSIDLNDPVSRTFLIRKISTQRNREQVASAVAAYASNHKDTVINSTKEREQLAVLITRRANRMMNTVPLARGLSSAVSGLKTRRYNFTESKGRGIRKFDGWQGFRIADAKTKSDAQRLASFIRSQTINKVRIIPYQAGKKTHYSVYSKNAVTVAQKSYVNGLKKYKSEPHIASILARVVERKRDHLKQNSSRSHGPTPILLTKKRIPELGLRMRVY